MSLIFVLNESYVKAVNFSKDTHIDTQLLPFSPVKNTHISRKETWHSANILLRQLKKK